ncbi:MAG: Chorismate lyase [Proteobacteria bacterium]|nr:Chorismate lyase [Pseudomonadota bacterium]
MNFKTRIAWRSKLPRSAAPVSQWLLGRGSLTARLQARGSFTLDLRYQGLARPTLDEAIALGAKRNRLLRVREVVLRVDGQALVFAHTVLPCRPRGPLGVWFARLGSRSLGALLFAHPGFARSAISCRRLDPRHVLFKPATDALQLTDVPPKVLWARRSRFVFGQQSVLVTEIFSPALHGV